MGRHRRRRSGVAALGGHSIRCLRTPARQSDRQSSRAGEPAGSGRAGYRQNPRLRGQEPDVNAARRKALIEQYKNGYRVVEGALAGATDDELDARPAPGKWSAREIVHHLADSEMTSAIRLRLLIATPSPAIVGYDQDEFAR